MNKQQENNVFVVEGYEMVGKSEFISSYLDEALTYRPSYEDINLNNYVPGNSRSLLGLTVMDFLSQNPEIFKRDLVLDRGLLSGILYAQLYPENGTSIEEEMNNFVELYRKMNSKIIYLYHDNKDLAYQMFESSKTRATNDSAFDPNTFEEYWDTYVNADKLSRKYLDKYFVPEGVNYLEVPVSKSRDKYYVVNKLLKFLDNNSINGSNR